ncbi:phage antirepressor KilAC domain-containing protein [Halalkalibacterium halodurans]|uniref:phage antirepressor KilAC domain-containing protein n=1 Tax=Halalkalibacterium halodurans TaxID=86665 RepID=UPI002E1A8E6D|nr:phage antirepressor KilAC domain-containing protein [Halalkalibacterium halodurans]MED4083910.1 phage antirepressor KilAC domain-containing protein [Halalkalibacterium halodurans]MED4105547.1 phage antirepressor KilAC domain-containing protein [Halalkalibacterium halodurans]MED4109247.1 phage antirepressor KilAC domain-containing protein [Halalkalibacterium halodurans]MED4149739.1 phage antirepressor KilAC domain-containing protein [Halalkalibacterium halodurans]
MNQLEVFENELFKVSAKIEGDQVLFDAEEVARSLGFVSKTEKNGKVYENVRWSRVNEFLPQVAEVGKGDLIPEPLVYKLAFKASNDIAEKFQDWLAVEVIPSIRKHGMYARDEILDNPDLLIEVASRLKEEREARMKLETKVKADKPKVLFADAVEVSEDSILIGELSKVLMQNGINIGQNRLFRWMRENGYLIRKRGDSYNLPTQKAMDLKLFEIKKRAINNPDGSVRTTRTTKVTGKGQIYFINKFLDQTSEVV